MKKTATVISLIVLLILGTIYLTPYLTLESLQNSQGSIQQYRQSFPGVFELGFFFVYVISTAISLPGAALLTLAAGAFFELWLGVLIVSFASTLGATLSFLIARYLLKDWARKKFAASFKKMDQGFEKEGSLYLFSLRLIPIFPFFLINVVMGLTKISVLRFFIVSQIGMLPATIIYVWAGQELSSIQSLSQILTLDIFLVFVALGLVPWLMKGILSQFKKVKMYSKYKKPKKFDYNLIVIGAGAGGLVSTAIAAAVKAKVALIEKHKMGGDCLNYGCVPSKALIHMSKQNPRPEFEVVRRFVQSAIQKIEPHDSVERFQGLGADVFKADAKLVSPWEVEFEGRKISARSIILATGAEPFVPSIPGLENVDYKTSETLWDPKDLSQKLLIVGGGPIGCELAQAFQKLGSQVTLLEKSDRLLSSESPEVSEFIFSLLQGEGIKVHLNSSLEEFQSADTAIVAQGNELKNLTFDRVIFAIGRKPRVAGFGLKELGVEISEKGTISKNEYLQTNYPNIFVCGDVAGPIQLTHVAGHQAWYAAVNALFGKLKKFKEDLRVIPRVTFTSPEVASVGLSQKLAQEQSVPFEVTHYSLERFDRAVCEGKNKGFIQILTKKNSDQILGVTIVADRAGEMLTEFTFAMRWNMGLKKILGTVHPYPSWSDANKMAALQWQKARTPHKLLKWVKKYHDWQRS